MSAWPPLAKAGDRFGDQRVQLRSGAVLVPCRLVRLWGSDVWLEDESGRVWCPSCRQLVDIVDLARVDNRHAVGLPHRAAGRLLPLGADTDRDPAEDWDFDA